MNLLEISNEEKSRLKKLNGDKSLVFALKKLFLNVCVGNPPSNEAIKKVTEAFHSLSTISPEDQAGVESGNLV